MTQRQRDAIFTPVIGQMMYYFLNDKLFYKVWTGKEWEELIYTTENNDGR